MNSYLRSPTVGAQAVRRDGRPQAFGSVNAPCSGGGLRLAARSSASSICMMRMCAWPVLEHRFTSMPRVLGR